MAKKGNDVFVEAVTVENRLWRHSLLEKEEEFLYLPQRGGRRRSTFQKMLLCEKGGRKDISLLEKERRNSCIDKRERRKMSLFSPLSLLVNAVCQFRAYSIGIRCVHWLDL